MPSTKLRSRGKLRGRQSARYCSHGQIRDIARAILCHLSTGHSCHLQSAVADLASRKKMLSKLVSRAAQTSEQKLRSDSGRSGQKARRIEGSSHRKETFFCDQVLFVVAAAGILPSAAEEPDVVCEVFSDASNWNFSLVLRCSWHRLPREQLPLRDLVGPPRPIAVSGNSVR